MIFHPPLGDVVQEKREKQRLPIGDRRHNLTRQRKLLDKPLRFEFGEISTARKRCSSTL